MFRKRIKWLPVALSCLLFLVRNGYAESKISEIRFVTTPPGIDGNMDDPAWNQADILTGFTIPEVLTVASDRSEVRIVFDDEKMYFFLKAYESYPQLMSRAAKVFPAESFEVFIQPKPDEAAYYQIAVSVTGEVYTGKILGAWSPQIEVKTSVKDDCWTVELAVPLADMGMSAPKEDKNIRFNIARNDWAYPQREQENKQLFSSFSLLDITDFHLPELWSAAVLTHRAGEPRTVANEIPYKNLFENPAFATAKDNYPVAWSIPPEYWKNRDVERRETMPMSGEWIIVAKGGSYVVISKNMALTPGTVYTVRVKARSFGQAALGILPQLKNNKEGSQVLWDCSLTPDFRYYNATFTADEDNISLNFYRIGPMTETDGIEIASIELFEGKLSPLSIRQHIPRGLAAEVAGTALPLTPNFYGSRNTGGKLRVLAVSYTLFTSREFLQLFSGLDVEADILVGTGLDQDTYYTESDPDMVKKRIDNAEYDLYLVGRVAVLSVGKELAQKIFSNVEKGAGLIIHPYPGRKNIGGNFTKIINEYKAKSIGPEHYLRRGLPVALYPQGEPVSSILEAQAGNGKIIVPEIDNYSWNLQIYVPEETLTYLTFPHQQYSGAWLARMLYYTAGRVKFAIKDVQMDRGQFLVKFEGEAQPSNLEWQLEDKNGNLVSKGVVKVNSVETEFKVPETFTAGYHVLALWLKDEKGAVIDYSTYTFKHVGPEITECQSSREFYTGNEEGEFTVKITGAKKSTTVDWKLEDFSGRIVESGSMPAEETIKFRVPLTSIYTNLARLWIYLRDGEKYLDARRFAVYLPDRDKNRLLNDFNVTVWPEGCTNPDGAPYINHILETMGVRAKNHSTHALSLNDGLGTTAMLETRVGNYFTGIQPKNNIRQPSLKDPNILREIEDRVKTQAKSDLKYGPFAVQVTDEPSLEGYAEPALWEVDAHPENLKIYRDRMKKQYGTIEKFNERCATDYKSFDELGLVLTSAARQRKNFAEFIQWRNYMVDTWVEAFRLVSDSYHSVNPDVPFSLENSFGQTAMSGNDYWKLLTRAGLGFSNEYTDMVSDDPIRCFAELYRSFRPDMRVWGYIGYSWGNEMATFQPWWFALHRFGGFSFYDTTGGEPGSSYNLVSTPGLGMTRKGELLQKAIPELLRGPGKIFLEYDWQKRDIAILYSQPSMLVAWCRGTENTKRDLNQGSPYYDYFYSRHNARYLLEELLYQYDFVAPEQLDKDILNSYKVLVLPRIEALSDANVQKITDFVARGGVVISDTVPAGYDELGTPRGKSPFENVNKINFVVLENIFDAKNPVQRQRVLELLQAEKIQPAVRSDDVVSVFGREAMHFVKGKMNIYAITRDYRRASDVTTQTFIFPTGKMHLYDLRTGTYLGETDRVTCAIPNAGTKVYGHYPYRVTGLEINVPAKVRSGNDLTVTIRLKTSTGEAGYHILHIEVLPPSGEARWFMKRNVTAPQGKAVFKFRMAENDPAGKWTLQITDVMTGITETKGFLLYQ